MNLHKFFILVILILFIINADRANAQWMQYNNGIYGGDVKALAAYGTTIFAGLNYSGTFRSTDNGSTWTKLEFPGGSSAFSSSICISGSTVIASNNDGMSYRSADNGDTWEYVNNNFARVFTEGSRMYAMGYQGTVFYYSENSGLTWNWISTGLSRLSTQAFSVHNGILYFASLNVDTGVRALLRSTDNGRTWTEIGNGLPSKDVRAIAFSGSCMYAGLYKAGSNKCLYRSSDDGITWENANLNFNTSDNWVSDIAASGLDIFVAAYDGIYLSTDNGATWSYQSSGLENPHLQTIAIANNNIYAGTIGAGVYRSSDNGVSWINASKGLSGTSVLSFGSDGRYLYAGTEGSGMYRSSNNGLNWTESGLKHADIMGLAANDNYLIASTLNNKINISTDHGSSWVNNLKLFCYNFAALIAGDKFYAATDFGILVSFDHGVTWYVANNGLTHTEMRTLAAIGDYVFAGSPGGGVFRSDDDGQNWTEANNGLSSLSVCKLMASGSNLYAGTLDGVFVSEDNGTSWRSAGLSGCGISALTQSGNFIYAGTTNGVYLTTDGGQSWSPKNDGLNNLSIMSLYAFNGKLFAGTWKKGVWMMPIIADDETAVWPGDANNDGTVNTADVLPIGLYYNKTGAARADKSSFWEPKPVKFWTPDVKPAFSDCDGNGLVNAMDVFSIGLNYGKTHAVSAPEVPALAAALNKASSSDKSLSFRIYDKDNQPVSLSSMKTGEEYFLSAVMNDASGLMGLSFDIAWMKEGQKLPGIKVIEDWESSGMKISSLWGSSSIKLSRVSQSEGKMSVGICRTDQTALDGKDAELVRIKIKMNENANLRFDFTHIIAIDKEGNPVEIKGSSLQSETTGTEKEPVVPSDFRINNYPNPFNPATKIRISLPYESAVSLSIYNSLGQEVARIISNEKLRAGTYEYNWNASDMSSGLYFCRMETSSSVLVSKLVVLK